MRALPWVLSSHNDAALRNISQIQINKVPPVQPVAPDNPNMVTVVEASN